MAHLGPGAAGKHQRHHTGNERQRGHQDRPQAQLARLDNRFQRVGAFGLKAASELDNQDGVFRCQADQYHQPDLYKHVVIAVHQPNADDRAEQTHGHNQQDRQGQQPTVVLRGQDQIGQQHTQRENEQRR